MARLGGDIGQLQNLQTQLTREAQNVAQLKATLTNLINSTWWEGPAANRFKSAWQGEYNASLTSLERLLQELSTEVQKRREALIQVSG